MSTTTEPTPVEHLLERLNDPKVAEGLGRLLNQLETVSFAVESADGFLRRGEVIADSLADSVAELKLAENAHAGELLRKAPQRFRTGTQLIDAASEINLDELSRSQVLTRLTDPQTLASLNQLLEKLPLITFLVESLEGFIGRGETIADNVSSAIQEMQLGEQTAVKDKFLHLIETLPKLAEAGEKLLDSELLGDGLSKVLDAGVTMIDSGMADHDVVQTLGELGKKGADTYKQVSSAPITPVGGFFATLKAMKDPDVQKSIGFFFAFAKAFSKHLK